MQKISVRLFLNLAGLVTLSSTGLAAAEQDYAGCKDHQLFTRMPNYYIYGCSHSQFDMKRFPVGPLVDENHARLQEVEGAFWQVDYVLNEGANPVSGLQIQRNFLNAAKRAGGTVEGTYPGGCKLMLDDSITKGANPCSDYGTTLKINKGGKEIWAHVYTNEPNYGIYILERKAMQQDISVNELVDKLNKDGFLTLYVNFDTGKATIKPDSNKILDDAASALKSAASLKVEVGGHTDNVGTPQSNEKLSSDRAQAVMAALVKRGVAANRLMAKGYGQNSPVADNRSEEGRAKNRRVELVKK
jgi:outer membrane protein OmpA-like peptidoglycan-associated protein